MNFSGTTLLTSRASCCTSTPKLSPASMQGIFSWIHTFTALAVSMAARTSGLSTFIWNACRPLLHGTWLANLGYLLSADVESSAASSFSSFRFLRDSLAPFVASVEEPTGHVPPMHGHTVVDIDPESGPEQHHWMGDMGDSVLNVLE